MDIHTGVIEVTAVKNYPTHEAGANAIASLSINDVRFVHYPDCQQLIIWLPQHGNQYSTLKVWNKTNNTIEEACPIIHWLNGAIQLLKDTLYLSPGNYTIEISTDGGIQHEVEFTKFHPVEVPALAASDSIDYSTVLKKISGILPGRIEYEGNARAGTITYIENDLRIKFDHEMGGGNCLFFIFIPTEKEWEARTKTAVNRRHEIIQFIAETVRRDQASSSRVVISNNEITYFSH